MSTVYTNSSLEIRMDIMILRQRWVTCLITIGLIFNGIVSFSVTANDTPTDLLVELNKASTITVKKSWFSFNKSYKPKT